MSTNDRKTIDPKVAPEGGLRPARTTGGLRPPELVVAVAATVAALATWVLWTQVGGVDLTVRTGDDVRAVGAGSVGVTAAVMAVAGALLLRLMRRWSAHGLRWWTIGACGVWLASMLGPLGATTASAGFALVSLHLVVGTIVVVGLRRQHRAASTHGSGVA